MVSLSSRVYPSCFVVVVNMLILAIIRVNTIVWVEAKKKA